MSRWLVTAPPSWLLLVGLIVVIAGGAMLVQAFVRRRFPALNGEEHNDVTKFTYGFIGFVYAFFIGFVVSSMWSQISTSDGNVRAEGAAAAQLATDLTVFETVDAERIRQNLLAYEQAAVAEWPHADAGRSTDADSALGSLYTAYREVAPKTDTQKTFLATSFSNLDKISQARTVRILTAQDDTGPPWPLWIVIFLNSAMVLGTVVVYGVERPALHYPMVAIVGVIVATNFFLLLELSHPYIGAIATSPDPLRDVVRMLSPR